MDTYIKDAINTINKAIELLQPKHNVLDMNDIYTLINCKCGSIELNSVLYKSLFGIVYTDDDIKSLTKDEYNKYNNLNHLITSQLWRAKSVFKNVRPDTMKAFEHITIKDNIAIYKP